MHWLLRTDQTCAKMLKLASCILWCKSCSSPNSAQTVLLFCQSCPSLSTWTLWVFSVLHIYHVFQKIMKTKSVSSAYCIFIGSPSSISVNGAVGKLGCICWRTISKVVVNATGLKLSPCETAKFDSKGLPITSLMLTLRLVLDMQWGCDVNVTT